MNFSVAFYLTELVGHRVGDDPYGAERGEIGEEFHPQGEEVLVVVAQTLDDGAYRHTLWEYSREAARDDRVAHGEYRMAWKLLKYSLLRIGAVPNERTDVIVALYLARESKMIVEQ